MRIKLHQFMILTVALFLVCGTSFFADAGETYKWKDRWGSIHFTDELTNIPKDAVMMKTGQGKGSISMVSNPHLSLKKLKTEIPYTMVGNSMIIQASVNGIPVRMILDTGASFVVIPPTVAELAGIKIRGVKETELATANGKTMAPQVIINKLNAGTFTAQNINAVVKVFLKDQPNLGLLGMSFLKHFKFHIDQDRKILLLEKRETN